MYLPSGLNSGSNSLVTFGHPKSGLNSGWSYFCVSLRAGLYSVTDCIEVTFIQYCTG